MGYSASQNVASTISGKCEKVEEFYNNNNTLTTALCNCTNRNHCKVKIQKCMETKVVYKNTVTTSDNVSE